MHTYEASELTLKGSRAHPWLTSVYDNSCRYHDFKVHPELIPHVLEDFMPWANYPAVQDFYSYLAWLNGPDSELESNDCAFSGIGKNLSPNITTKRHQASGRIMVFFRSLALNCEDRNSEWLLKCFSFYLERVEPELQFGVIGLSTATTEFSALNRQLGKSLVLNFWAWGDSEAETMDNFRLLIRGLSEASSEVCKDILKGQP